jgi:hypothetical protein
MAGEEALLCAAAETRGAAATGVGEGAELELPARRGVDLAAGVQLGGAEDEGDGLPQDDVRPGREVQLRAEAGDEVDVVGDDVVAAGGECAEEEQREAEGGVGVTGLRGDRQLGVGSGGKLVDEG